MDTLKIDNFSYSYTKEWSRKKVKAVNELTFSLQPGELTGFLGHNGSGKTTTIKAILGLINIQHGNIEVFGSSVKNPFARKKIGFISERPYFYKSLTVFESLRFYATISGIRNKFIKPAISKALKRVDLKCSGNAKISSLSKGMLQRVSLAQAIMHEPEFLVLDEPFSGLDPVGRKDFREVFAELNSKGCTILMSSHVLADVEAMCDRVLFMKQGNLVNEFKLHDAKNDLNSYFEIIVDRSSEVSNSLKMLAVNVLESDKHVTLKFKDRSCSDLALKDLLSSGAEIVKYQPVTKSLEEVFVEVLES